MGKNIFDHYFLLFSAILISSLIGIFFLLAIICAKFAALTPAWLVIKGIFNNYSQLALSAGSFFKLAQMKSQNSLLHFSVFNLGGSFEVIMYIAFKGGILRFGGSPSASSIAMIPVLHTSTFSLYSFLRMSSGAIHAGVPTTDLRRCFSEVSYVAKPKSAIFTSPSLLRRMLSDFRSR